VFLLHDAHERLGKVVRFGPTEVVISDPRLLKTIMMAKLSKVRSLVRKVKESSQLMDHEDARFCWLHHVGQTASGCQGAEADRREIAGHPTPSQPSEQPKQPESARACSHTTPRQPSALAACLRRARQWPHYPLTRFV
jgi:hypothetical protein